MPPRLLHLFDEGHPYLTDGNLWARGHHRLVYRNDAQRQQEREYGSGEQHHTVHTVEVVVDMMEAQIHQINIFIIMLLVEEQKQEQSIITNILMIRRLNFKYLLILN